jgi:holo-[acyl-carrier protein] synthase
MSDDNALSNTPNTVAHGIDHVDIADFSRLLIPPLNEHLERYFTTAELIEAGKGGSRAEKLASRFAIKEAVLKALGTGWGRGIAFTDVEVTCQPSGAPAIALHRQLKVISENHRITKWLVSASHSSSIAIASVIALTS